MFKKFLYRTEDKTNLINFNKDTGIIEDFYKDSNIINIFNESQTFYATNFDYIYNDNNEIIKFSLIMQISQININIFDIQLNFMFSIPMENKPIKTIFRKKNNINNLYIYNAINMLIKYDLNDIGNLKFF